MISNLTIELKDIIQTLALIAAAVGVWVRLRGIQNQLWLQAFTEYTRRYADAIANMPFEARSAGPPEDVDALNAEAKKNILTAMRRYFNLCSEELYLHERGRIDKKTWEIWKTGISETAKWPHFASSWRTLRRDYTSYAIFCSFMDEIVKVYENADVRSADKAKAAAE